MKNNDLHVKILLLSPILKILVLENQCKIMVPLFGAAYALFFTDLGLQKHVESSCKWQNSRTFQGL